MGAALIPFCRYLMLGIALYVTLRLLLAMFFKKVTRPVRGVLLNTITREETPVYDTETSIGRKKTCDIVLGFDTISRLHGVLAFRRNGFVVFDTFSKAGVTVNGKKIDGKAQVYDGDVIGFGGVEYILNIPKFRFIKDKSGLVGNPSYFGILILLAVFNIASLLINCTPGGAFDLGVVLCYCAFIALQWVYFIFASYVLRIHNFEIEMLAFLFTSVGLAIVGSVYPDLVLKQLVCVFAGIIGYCVLVLIMRRLDFVKNLRWVVAGLAIALLGVTLVIGKVTNGALNWVKIGGISIQPSELAKVAFVFVGGVTLEKLQSIRHLTAYIIFAAFCVGELFLMYDFGAALIFFFTFIVIAFMRSGDIRTLILICIAAAIGAGIILYFKPYVATRFSTYTHIWDLMDAGGFQQSRALIYSASGGLFGLGLGNGALRNVYAATEDLVFGIVCEEFGMIMAFLIPIAYAAVTASVIMDSRKAKSTLYSIVAVAASSMMLFQTVLNVFGVTDILPMTGVTLPFVSKGGTSIISCYCLLAFMKCADSRTFASFKPQLERRPGNENNN